MVQYHTGIHEDAGSMRPDVAHDVLAQGQRWLDQVQEPSELHRQVVQRTRSQPVFQRHILNPMKDTMYITLIERINIARDLTAKASQIKDWKLRRQSDRRMKEIAKELTDGKGYIKATARQLHEAYPDLMPPSDDDHYQIWCIDESITGSQRLGFTAI